ncbi:MAG TPA: hypothetical protein DCP03_06460 [Polaromonas sp.]|nr:hypothetical protein [Polaromonas sp.]
MLSKGSVKTDWEADLGVVIGTRACYVSRKEALNHVASCCAINDCAVLPPAIARSCCRPSLPCRSTCRCC